MNNRLLSALGASLLLCSGVASADVIANLSFTTPSGTVGPTDSIDVWVTLSLDAASDPLTFDASVNPLADLPSSLIPAAAEVWNGSGYDSVPFDSYEYTSQFTSRVCSGTFTNACSDGEYHIEAVTSGSNTWFGTSSLNLTAGESQSFLIYQFTPTNGSAAPGDYIFYSAGLGFTVHGIDMDGNSIEQDIAFDACTSQSDSCAFTRTVSAVPVPAAVWLFGSGLLGLLGLAKRRAA